MVRIYIRHSEKAYRNGQNETFKHDPPITEEGKAQARQLAHLLIQKYGVPVLIMCSPYRRTRETAEAMRDHIVTVSNNVPALRCDNLLSEYLGNHEETDVTNETASFAPPHHDEPLGAFKSRIRKHNTLASVLDDLTQPVWFITHCFVMSTLADILSPGGPGGPGGPTPNRGSLRQTRSPGSLGNKQRHPFRKLRPLGCLYIEKTMVHRRIPNAELQSFLEKPPTTPTKQEDIVTPVFRAVLLRFPSLYKHMPPHLGATRSNDPPHLGSVPLDPNGDMSEGPLRQTRSPQDARDAPACAGPPPLIPGSDFV